MPDDILKEVRNTAVSVKSANLSDVAQKYMPNIVSGLAGTAVGGGLGYATTQREDGESQEEYEARRRNNAISGLMAGGAFGTAAPSLYEALPAMLRLGGTKPPPTTGEKLQSAGVDLMNQAGKALDVVLPAAPYAVPTGVGGAVGGAGGYAAGAIKDKLESDRHGFIPTKPSKGAPAPTHVPKVKTKWGLIGVGAGSALGLLASAVSGLSGLVKPDSPTPAAK